MSFTNCFRMFTFIFCCVFVGYLSAGISPGKTTPFCNTFSGALKSYCNEFCATKDCDSLSTKATSTFCLSREKSIKPLLAKFNALHNTSYEIIAANKKTQTPGNCGVKVSACPCLRDAGYTSFQQAFADFFVKYPQYAGTYNRNCSSQVLQEISTASPTVVVSFISDPDDDTCGLAASVANVGGPPTFLDFGALGQQLTPEELAACTAALNDYCGQ